MSKNNTGGNILNPTYKYTSKTELTFFFIKQCTQKIYTYILYFSIKIHTYLKVYISSNYLYHIDYKNMIVVHN